MLKKMALLPLHQIVCHSDQIVLKYKLQKFGDFHIHCMAKWVEGHKLSSNMATAIKASRNFTKFE